MRLALSQNNYATLEMRKKLSIEATKILFLS